MRTSVLRVPLIDIKTNFPSSEADLRLDLLGCHAHRVLFLASRSCAIALLCKNILSKRSDSVSTLSDPGISRERVCCVRPVAKFRGREVPKKEN